MEINKIELQNLTLEESREIYGGDKFLYDLGNSIGRIGRWLHNTSQSWLESIGNGNLYHPGKM